MDKMLFLFPNCPIAQEDACGPSRSTRNARPEHRPGVSRPLHLRALRAGRSRPARRPVNGRRGGACRAPGRARRPPGRSG
ncbi:hypothetical protein F8O01_09890 [Pseudoclavibacter chungangensis]|uniref:Uncharacterized protein n=1 Tax=Pseudoclavibacter chungangensis TaxID=587635 RepID=A0A7J5BRP9_9MICO|nr:hypothetical protein F8O01_09890 [Pseudoclavibacter chungangensis]